MANLNDSGDSNPKIFLEKTSVIVIHTGNTIGELKRKTTSSATEELIECMATTLNCWAGQLSDEEKPLLLDVLHCYSQKDSVKINSDERKDLKLSVKILLGDFDCDALTQAVRSALRKCGLAIRLSHTPEVLSSYAKSLVCIQVSGYWTRPPNAIKLTRELLCSVQDGVLEELDVTVFESVIISFPPIEDKLTMDQIQPLWSTLEELVEKGKIITIGISDLDTELLIELHNWAKVKPSANQVNLASCCIIPPEMQAFAKENDILLLTHNDPKEILPQDQLNQLLSKTVSFPAGVSWRPLWIARYSALVKCRGVIQNKGFISYLEKK